MDQAYVLINCKYKSSPEVRKKINELDGITEAKQIFGVYDCIVKTKKMPKNELRKFIQNEIRTLDNIQSTLTLKLENIRERKI
jgi:hypothetical protein